jgi:Spy/CpxP family protein refolding chaperone
LVAAALAVALCGARAAQAQGPEGHEGPQSPGHEGFRPPPLERVLAMSEEQTQRFQAMRSEKDEALRPLRDQERRAHEDLRKAMEATSPDPTVVGKKALAVHAVMTQMKAIEDRFHERLVEMLEPQQREKLQLLDEMHPHHGGPGSPPPPQE